MPGSTGPCPAVPGRTGLPQPLSAPQSKKHANKVRRYLSIHGEDELAPGKRMKVDANKQVRQRAQPSRSVTVGLS